MAAITFLTRFAFIALLKNVSIPAWISVWLKFLPVTILTSLIVPALLFPRNRVESPLTNEYLLAGLIAGLVAYKSKNLVLVIAVGISCVLMLRWFFTQVLLG